jgi:hypothetical protein
MLKDYDPDRAPDLDKWRECDEAERLELVSSYHHSNRIHLPNADLHAMIHVVVENQLAEGEPVVIATLDRLQSEGLDRHDGIHAIGSVLVNYLYDLMRDQPPDGNAAYREYLGQLEQLRADSWRQSG